MNLILYYFVARMFIPKLNGEKKSVYLLCQGDGFDQGANNKYKTVSNINKKESLRAEVKL